MGRDSNVYLKTPFQFNTELSGVRADFVNFIEQGPATDSKIRIAINEFDHRMRSMLNLSDPECFKAMILPLGLEEMRVIVCYEYVNLQTLIIATQTNQLLLDNCQR